jgi:hypothetical protein
LSLSYKAPHYIDKIEFCWKRVLIILIFKGDIEGAQKAKEELEILQRHDRKLREKWSK